MIRISNKTRLISGMMLLAAVLSGSSACADDGSADVPEAPAAPRQASRLLRQFPAAEVAPSSAMQAVAQPLVASPANAAVVSTVSAPAAAQQAPSEVARPDIDFPKVQTSDDEALAKRFSWWPTDAKPAPVKDGDRSGYWWWPDIPGEARPWGNQGFVYVRKIIFDYKSSEGEMKPSLVIKRVIKNVKVYFDYDKSDIREDAGSILKKALYTLEHNPKADILITGNADVRGSEQYNLKLGERRAAAVKNYMSEQGLPEERILILSRGKLDAMAPTGDLVGMQRDRNAQFMIAEVEEVMIPAEKAALFKDKIIEEKVQLEGEIRVDSKEYVIQTGDTLWSIAQREYGDGMQWKRLFEFNRDVISNPDKPKKGTKIRIPIE